MRRIGKKIRSYFSCFSETRDGDDGDDNNDNVVNVRPVNPHERMVEVRRNVLFPVNYPVYFFRNGRRERRKTTTIIGILKINMNNIENIDIDNDNDINIETALELKEMGVYTKDDVNILCSICLEKIDYMNNIRFIQPCCGQVYHLDCIGKWVRENQSCPICKNPLLLFTE